MDEVVKAERSENDKVSKNEVENKSRSEKSTLLQPFATSGGYQGCCK